MGEDILGVRKNTNRAASIVNPDDLDMTTCVIGGTGFIGRYLVSRLVASGREVRVVGRSDRHDLALPPGASYHACDANDVEHLRAIIRFSNEVIDLSYATVPKTSFDNPLYDLEANLPHSVKLLEIAKDLNSLRRLIVVSSGGTVYGEVRSLPIDEDAPTNPISPYGITKLAIERYAQMYHRLFGLPVMVVRPANAYGPGQRVGSGQGFVAAAIAKIACGEPVTVYGGAGTIRDYIHVDDVAAGIHATLDKGIPGSVYNIGTGIGSSNNDVLELIRPLALKDGKQLNILSQPARNFDVPANVLSSSRLTAQTGWKAEKQLKDGVAEVWATCNPCV